MAKAAIPTKVNNYNVYAGDGAEKLLGMGDEMTLPDFEASAEDVSGAGILGEISDPTVGYFSNQEMEIPFRVLDTEATDMLKMTSAVKLTVRGAVQTTNPTGDIEMSGIRVVVRGRVSKFSTGKMQRGAAMDTRVTLALLYILIEIDGSSVLELDKLNDVFKVNGEDVLAEVRKLI